MMASILAICYAQCVTVSQSVKIQWTDAQDQMAKKAKKPICQDNQPFIAKTVIINQYTPKQTIRKSKTKLSCGGWNFKNIIHKSNEIT